MRGVALIVVVLAFSASAAGTTGSGLFGKVTLGPVTPVCAAERPCTRAAAGARLEFLRSGVVTARAVTSKDGTYRLALQPGSYLVRVASARLGRRIAPAHVRVAATRWSRQNFSIDTGIR